MKTTTKGNRLARAAAAKAAAERVFTETILEAAAAGVPYRTIGELAGVSKSRVAQIVARSRDRAA